jgi:hypothetical protein
VYRETCIYQQAFLKRAKPLVVSSVSLGGIHVQFVVAACLCVRLSALAKTWQDTHSLSCVVRGPLALRG